MTTLNILVTGDRNWNCPITMLQALLQVESSYPNMTYHLMHGGCRGADVIAAYSAVQRGWKVTERSADWVTHGKSAGPIRNRQMLKEHQPVLLLAFHNNPMDSRGTRDMVTAAQSSKPHPLYGGFAVARSHRTIPQPI